MGDELLFFNRLDALAKGGLPALLHMDKREFLAWSFMCFRISSSTVVSDPRENAAYAFMRADAFMSEAAKGQMNR